jgi:hypothetical protein
MPKKLLTSSPFGGLSPDPLSSIADSPELLGQQSPHRSNISIPQKGHGNRKTHLKTMAALQRRHFLKGNLSIKSPLFRRLECGVEHHFIGLFEKVHRPPKYPETLRLQVAFKVLLGIPFFKKPEFIFILCTLTKVAALASLLRPYGPDQ